MFSTIVTSIVSLANLAVMAILLRAYMRDSKAKSSQQDNQRVQQPERDYSDLLSRLTMLEEREIATDLPQTEKEQPQPEATVENRIAGALQMLQMGESPEEVGREYGYSQSEMGILLATARRSAEIAEVAESL